MIRRLVLGTLLLLAAVPAIAAGRYSADRYDSRIEVLRGGTIRVTETIAIQFETGSFSQFYRAIPASHDRRHRDRVGIDGRHADATRKRPGAHPDFRFVERAGDVAICRDIAGDPHI